MVIPAMDHIDKYLSTKSLNKDTSPAVQFSINTAKHTLNQCYELANSSDIY